MTTTYAAREYLLPKAKRAVAGMTPFRWPDAGRIVRDAEDREIGFLSAGKAGPYIFACKRSLHQDTYASFMPRLIGVALTIGREHAWSTTPKLALFVGAGEPYHIEDAWVFDPRRVANQAEKRTFVDSKQERNVPVFDVSARAHGIPLGDHLAGRTRLPGPAGAGTHATVLREYGVEV